MEFEFDKEIDAILRKARGGVEAAASPAAHMDADELAAFAENAVTGAARTRYVGHLADCTRCRKILSNIILTNSEAETETASSVVSAAATEARVPWYRRLFVFPQLAYTMGGAVLVFSAFFGYLIIRNLPGAQNDVSFSANKAAPVSRVPANTASEPAAADNSNTAATSTNSSAPPILSAPSNASSTANSASAPVGNSSMVARQAQPEKSDNNIPIIVPQATVAPESKSEAKPLSVDGASRDELAKSSPAAPTAGAVSQNRAKEEERDKDNADMALREDKNSVNNPQAKRKTMSVPKPVEKTQSNAGATRSVGGKSFNNVGGIWFDTTVGKQKQKTVRRGTSEYLRLDGGLRSIADQLGGTVVILWGGKAYRIE